MGWENCGLRISKCGFLLNSPSQTLLQIPSAIRNPKLLFLCAFVVNLSLRDLWHQAATKNGLQLIGFALRLC